MYCNYIIMLLNQSMVKQMEAPEAAQTANFKEKWLNCPEWDDIDMTLNFVGSACTSILQVVKGSSSVSCSSVCPVSTRVCVAAALSGDHNYTEMNTLLREMLQTLFHAQSTSYNT